jgi:hypothetical protein
MCRARAEQAASPGEIYNRLATPFVASGEKEALAPGSARNDMTGADARRGAAKLTLVLAIQAAVRRGGDKHRLLAPEAAAQVSDLGPVAARS